jgi:hypothetical protein
MTTALMTADDTEKASRLLKTGTMKVWVYAVIPPGPEGLRPVWESREIVHPKMKWADLPECMPSEYRTCEPFFETTGDPDDPLFFRVHSYPTGQDPEEGDINLHVMGHLTYRKTVKGEFYMGQLQRPFIAVGNAYERRRSLNWDHAVFSTYRRDPYRHGIEIPLNQMDLLKAIKPHINGAFLVWAQDRDWHMVTEDRKATTKLKLYFG